MQRADAASRKGRLPSMRHQHAALAWYMRSRFRYMRSRFMRSRFRYMRSRFRHHGPRRQQGLRPGDGQGLVRPRD